MKKLLIAFSVFLLLSGCASKKEQPIDFVDVTNQENNFYPYLKKDGVYQFVRKDKTYIVFYGSESKYEDIKFDVKDEILTISFKSLYATSGFYQVFEITNRDAFHTISLLDGNAEALFESVILEG